MFKKMFKQTRVIVLLVFLILAVFAIHPNPWATGATIRTVRVNSSASIGGVTSASPNARPMARERIILVNNHVIANEKDYYEAIADFKPNRTVFIKTNLDEYSLTTKPIVEIKTLPEMEELVIIEIVEEWDNETNSTINKTVERTIEVNKTETTYLGTDDIGISVYDSPFTNLKKGLDLQGGTRVLLEPEEVLNSEDMNILIDNMKRRLNVYGLTDIVVTQVNELPEPLGSGKQYILVEIAGANEEEVKDLISKQGKFEAKVANTSVFKGGKDITYVCRSADCAGIDPNGGCSATSEEEWFCRFRFSIALSPEAAQNQADATDKLEVVARNGEEYLSEPLGLYLDDSKVDELQIGADLKGRAVTDIAISGSGTGKNQQEAVLDSLQNMKRLQTILITGSLPVKLNIVKTDNISPVLGKEFINNAILIGVLALLAVAFIMLIRYRKLKILLPLVFTSIAEVVLLMGFASLVGWNLDIAAIAGIIIVVGTGVDHLIVITDETLRGEEDKFVNWKDTLKKAMFIIVAAYVTTVVAMIPLWWAGAGLLKGFAITTIAGVTFGVFIARPAFAAMIEVILKN